MPTQHDLIVPNLGPCQIDSPLKAKGRTFLDEAVRVRFENEIGGNQSGAQPISSENTRARENCCEHHEHTAAAANGGHLYRAAPVGGHGRGAPGSDRHERPVLL